MQQQISEVKRLLQNKKMIKIKILRSADLSKKDDIIDEVVKKTQSILINRTGNTFTIHKE